MTNSAPDRLSFSTTSSSTLFDLSSGIPREEAVSATAEGVSVLSLPLGASGRVITKQTSNSVASERRTLAATSGVPANAIFIG